MPRDVTIFAAKYLVFIAALLAVLMLAVRLRQQPRSQLLWWACAAGLLLVLSFAFAKIGGAVYNDPRPFTTSHVPPLIPHAADNGFPSDHALLAAALAALVALVDLTWALPLVILAVFVDWARVGAGIHHVVDVGGASVFVAIATLVAIVVAPFIVRWLSPYLPAGWRETRLRSPQRR